MQVCNLDCIRILHYHNLTAFSLQLIVSLFSAIFANVCVIILLIFMPLV